MTKVKSANEKTAISLMGLSYVKISRYTLDLIRKPHKIQDIPALPQLRKKKSPVPVQRVNRL